MASGRSVTRTTGTAANQSTKGTGLDRKEHLTSTIMDTKIQLKIRNKGLPGRNLIKKVKSKEMAVRENPAGTEKP